MAAAEPRRPSGSCDPAGSHAPGTTVPVRSAATNGPCVPRRERSAASARCRQASQTPRAHRPAGALRRWRPRPTGPSRPVPPSAVPARTTAQHPAARTIRPPSRPPCRPPSGDHAVPTGAAGSYSEIGYAVAAWDAGRPDPPARGCETPTGGDAAFGGAPAAVRLSAGRVRW
ncbi:hypothetical protein E1281_34660 [Actinomadura sp. KC345]|nr:hypothetical protein E1281_34660 [Actinomadura sp. KC345]